MLLTSLGEIIVGIIILQLVTMMSFAKTNVELYIAVTGGFIYMYNLGAWTIIWHVTFKYWETARQFSRLVRICQTNDNIEELVISNTGSAQQDTDSIQRVTEDAPINLLHNI